MYISFFESVISKEYCSGLYGIRIRDLYSDSVAGTASSPNRPFVFTIGFEPMSSPMSRVRSNQAELNKYVATRIGFEPTCIIFADNEANTLAFPRAVFVSLDRIRTDDLLRVNQALSTN